MKIDQIIKSIGPEKIGTDIQLAITEESIANVKRVLENRTKALGRVGTYEYKGGARRYSYNRTNFTPPVYDLAEISRAADVEPLISNSIRKHREQILKEGYRISGPETTMVNYVNKRLFEIALVTGIPTGQIIREVITNLIKFHNAYIVLRRDSARSSGKPIKMYNKVRAPIAGLFVPDPTTMEVKVDKYGTVKQWKQTIPGEAYSSDAVFTFAPEDVIHISLDKKSGYTFGTPYIMPVLDDVRALRRLEELAIMLVSKEAFPLYHYKVGTEQKPATVYANGSTEVDAATSRVANLPEQGFVVTSERHSIELVSKQGAGLDMQPYLDYFQQRVLSGLRLSSVDLGIGGTSNRGTATTMNKNMADAAKDYQEVTSDVLSNTLVLWLCLEGNFDVLPENQVKFHFPMIDREELRAHQTHGLNLFMSDAITQDEFRKEYLNKQEIGEGEELFSDMKLARDIKLAQSQPRPASTTSSGDRAIKAKVSTSVQPRNQHKVSQAKPSIPANDSLSFFECVDTIEEAQLLLKNYVLSSKDQHADDIKPFITKGWTAALEEAKLENDVEPIGKRAYDRFINNYLVKSYWAVCNPILEKYDDAAIDSCIKELEESITKLEEQHKIVADGFGFVSLAKRAGYKIIEVIDLDGNTIREIDLSEMRYTDLIMQNEERRLRLP